MWQGSNQLSQQAGAQDILVTPSRAPNVNLGGWGENDNDCYQLLSIFLAPSTQVAPRTCHNPLGWALISLSPFNSSGDWC